MRAMQPDAEMPALGKRMRVPDPADLDPPAVAAPPVPAVVAPTTPVAAPATAEPDAALLRSRDHCTCPIARMTRYPTC